MNGLCIVMLHTKDRRLQDILILLFLGVKQNLLIGDSMKEYIGFVHAHGKPTQVI